ncbi:MAG TPA: class I SAM-dependent methyltransferase [Bryobacteraceae bacterium]|nr:class I SAM-dependent methyltransferase [Bryobacteraceae bacterium]
MQRIDSAVKERMQHDWNERAREDAHFYVAFGRQNQDDEEFFATGAEVVKGIEWEMRRLGPGRPRARRALEIGCGPGRLMRPLSRHFGEIHGVDVSDEMVARARRNLASVPHAHPHHGSGADLAQFADESFDLVYSYAVFQHIPSREVVMSYLDEACRVLKPGGIIRAQINGLDQTAKQYDTWSGVRISADEVRQFALDHGLQLFALEGTRTQYMWTTFRKPNAATDEAVRPARIRRITNALNSEPVAPQAGRYASVTAWVEHLPDVCDLLRLQALVDGQSVTPCYIGPAEHDGMRQVNVLLGNIPRTGLLPFELKMNGHLLCDPATLRVIPPAPSVPLILSASDGINMMSGTRIVTGTLKVTIEQTADPFSFAATVGGRPVRNIDVFCADPLPPRYEINCDLPEGLEPGTHVMEMRLGRRSLPSVTLDIVAAPSGEAAASSSPST